MSQAQQAPESAIVLLVNDLGNPSSSDLGSQAQPAIRNPITGLSASSGVGLRTGTPSPESLMATPMSVSSNQRTVLETVQAAYLINRNPVKAGEDITMSEMSRYAVAAVGGLHLLFMIAEIGFWKTLVPRLGIYNRERAVATAPVGANMGIYNGILGTILIWLAWNAPGLGAEPFRAFGTCLLAGVIVAGIFGGATIRWTIPLFQSLPALVALALLRASG